MSDALTFAERDAIDRYDGPVTICPPRTFSEPAPVTKVKWKSSDVKWLMDPFSGCRRRGTRPDFERDRTIARMGRAGATQVAIAKATGLTLSGAHFALHRLGLHHEWKAARAAA